METKGQLTYGLIAPNRPVAAALALVDRVGTLLRSRRPKPSRFESVLLIFFGSFGDGLIFTSILKSLREHLPDARIDVLASTDVGAVLQGCPYLSNVFITKMPSGKEYPSKVPGLVPTLRNLRVTYDAALCPRGPIDNGILPLFLSRISRYNVGFSTGGFSFCLDEVVPWRPGIHETEHLLDVVQAICPECTLGRQELFHNPVGVAHSLSHKLADLGLATNGQFIVVHPGSKVMRRSLSSERWRTVLTDLLEKTTYPILVTGIPDEKPFFESFGVTHPRVIPTFGFFTIPELAELVKQAAGVVTVETFVSHLAGVAGVPAVAFWTGVTDVRQWRPAEGIVDVRTVAPPCSPCFRWCDNPVCMDHDTSGIVEQILKAK